MDNATFDRLPDEEKLACLLGFAASMFGEERVRMLHDRLAPVVRDCCGQGQEDDYWGGVWQIYRAE